MLNLTHFTEISLFSNTTPKSIDAFVLSWHKFQNAIKVETRIFYSQLLTKTFPLPHYMVLLQQSKQMTCHKM
jgi:hypothetical protein